MRTILSSLVVLAMLPTIIAGAEQNSMLIRNPYIFPDRGWEQDWRAFENAKVVTDVKAGRGQVTLPKGYQYSEGMASCELKSGVRLQSTHVAVREGHPSQHLIYRCSKDKGTTWSEWMDVEPEGPPMPTMSCKLCAAAQA